MHAAVYSHHIYYRFDAVLVSSLVLRYQCADWTECWTERTIEIWTRIAHHGVRAVDLVVCDFCDVADASVSSGKHHERRYVSRDRVHSPFPFSSFRMVAFINV